MDDRAIESARRVRRLLLATDLSANAEVALQWARRVAVDHGATLHLVHASSLAGWSTDFLEIDAQIPQQIQTDTRRAVEDLAGRCAADGVEVVCEVLNGEPSSVILATAARHEVDLIVVGTRGQRGLDYLLLGSTAQRVVQRAHCPVVTLHEKVSAAPGTVSTILAATDFSAESRSALAAALALAGPQDRRTKLLLVHAFMVPYDLMTQDGSVCLSEGLDQWRSAQREVEQRLDSWAATLGRQNLEIQTLGLEGYPPEAIIKTAGERPVDLIAMGTHGRTGLSHALLGSTAERVIHRAPCPVLTCRR